MNLSTANSDQSTVTGLTLLPKRNIERYSGALRVLCERRKGTSSGMIGILDSVLFDDNGSFTSISGNVSGVSGGSFCIVSEECLNKCRLYDNRKQEEQYYDYVRGPLKKPQPMQHQSFKTHYSFQKSPQTFSTPQKPHQPFYNAQRPQNSFNTQNTRPNFYSQFNNQPKPFSGSINKPINQSFRNFTNKQVFGNPKPIIPQSQYKPTPMSEISTFTNNKIKPPQNFDQSSSNPRRNFISEELNNVEPEQLEVVQDELEEIYQGDHIQDDYDQKEDENFL
ncbi:hypothetical protein FQA39_LY18423 [Lamprigera yunnana]|nr:hypothetical protein FQA39_LY18423 [Lamprigera yunnana]